MKPKNPNSYYSYLVALVVLLLVVTVGFLLLIYNLL